MNKKTNTKNSQKTQFGKWSLLIITIVVLGVLLMSLFGGDGTDSGINEDFDNKIENGTHFDEDDSKQATDQEIELQQQTEAEYEKWLAAAVIMGISVEYPDFQLSGIYAVTSTGLENKESSKGVYVIFESDGKDLAIYSVPVETERTEKGTIDISTMNLGLATFGLVDVQDIAVENLQMIYVEEVGKLISETMQFTVYHH